MADSNERTILEEIEVGGAELVQKVKELVRAGNVRTLRIVAKDGDTALEMPLTIGLLAGGVVALAAPWLAVLGVVAALAKHVKLVVERVEEGAAPSEAPAETPKEPAAADAP